jgi:hypothetical protein
MLDMARVTPEDFLMDLGSGDGRLVISAARRGVRAVGVEYNPDLVELAKQNAEKAGVAARASFVNADLFQTDLAKATVITMFLLSDINRRLRPTLLELKPGTRIVSNTFDMGSWEPDKSVTLYPNQGCADRWCTAHLWIVPAYVGGVHKTPHGELTLNQEFQMLSGFLRTEGRQVRVRGKVLGEDVALTAGEREIRAKAKEGRLVF